MRTLGQLVAAMEAGLAEGIAADPPAPWLGWLLVCLCRQRARQTWLRRVYEARLADVEEDEGPVPGLEGWSYSFHGMGLCLSGPRNEHLDVDFHDDEGATIDPYFFANRALRLNPAPPPERRLGELFADSRAVVFALHQLRASGALVHESSEHVFRLVEPIEALHRAVAAEPFDDPQVEARWAKALGDGPETGARFADWLTRCSADRVAARELLPTIEARLEPAAARRVLLGLLEGPVDSTTGYAAAALGRLGSESAAVEEVLGRLDPARHHPFPAFEVCRFLLARDRRREDALRTLEAFAAVDVVKGYRGNPYADRLAVLLLEHAPDRALPHVRRALRSTTPGVVQDIAATLALLGQPWCIRELTAALEGPADEERTTVRRYLAAALARSGSEVARQRSKELEPEPPEHSGVGFTFDEVVAANLDSSFRGAVEHVRATAQRLRGRLPDDYGAGE